MNSFPQVKAWLASSSQVLGLKVYNNVPGESYF